MSFDLRSFARAVPNSSDSFDYYRNNASRLTTAKQVTKESPFDEQTVVDLFGPPPADAMLVFAAPGADAHSTPS
jgi:hypothetical protein